MAISFVGSAGAGGIDGADVSVDLSGLGLQENDLVIVAYVVGKNDNVDVDLVMLTSGYIEVADLFANDDQDCHFGAYYKVMGATPDSSAQVEGHADLDSGVAALALAFRGVDPTTPMDVTPTTATGIDTNRPDPPSIDHNNPSGVWTVAAGAFTHGSGASVTATAPTNYTGVSQASGNDQVDAVVAMAYRADPGDPEDPGVFTPSIADSVANGWGAVTMALRPAGGAAGHPAMRLVQVPELSNAPGVMKISGGG